jgi:hypothetical protein
MRIRNSCLVHGYGQVTKCPRRGDLTTKDHERVLPVVPDVPGDNLVSASSPGPRWAMFVPQINYCQRDALATVTPLCAMSQQQLASCSPHFSLAQVRDSSGPRLYHVYVAELVAE